MVNTTPVLVLDDEALIAFDVAASLEANDVKVLGPATSLEEGFEISAKTMPAFALLDIDINGQLVWPLARKLSQNGCKIVFISANAAHKELAGEFRDAPVLDKPVCAQHIMEALHKTGFFGDVPATIQ